MWASATEEILARVEMTKLSYPLKCGLLQLGSGYSKVTFTELSYPLKCGLLQLHNSKVSKITNPVVIPTQMWASATFIKDQTDDYYELSYPLKCGLLQRRISVHVKIRSVVIPTQMWASATMISIISINCAKLSYPLKCGLLQLSRDRANTYST